jgi:hypothetical protein
MSASVAGQITQLRTFSRQQLLDMWQKLYDRAAPPGIRRELLERGLAVAPARIRLAVLVDGKFGSHENPSVSQY